MVEEPNPGDTGGRTFEQPPTFEQLMDELEDITERLAAGDLGIEAAADLYERAERLHSLATERLAQVKARVEALTSGREPGA